MNNNKQDPQDGDEELAFMKAMDDNDLCGGLRKADGYVVIELVSLLLLWASYIMG